MNDLGVVIEHETIEGSWHEVWRGLREDWLTVDADHPLPPAERDLIRALTIGQSHNLDMVGRWRVTPINAAGLAPMPPAVPVAFTSWAGPAQFGVRISRHPQEPETTVVGLQELPGQPSLTEDGTTEAVVAALCQQYRLHPSNTIFLRCTLNLDHNEELLFTWAYANGEQLLPVRGSLKSHRRTAASVRSLLGLPPAS